MVTSLGLVLSCDTSGGGSGEAEPGSTSDAATNEGTGVGTRGGSDAESSTGMEEADSSDGGPAPTTFGGERPVTLQVPDDYDPAMPTPLVFLLHGFSATGALQDGYFGMSEAANERGVLYAFPDGIPNSQSSRFWNATDACCNFEATDVDDAAYLRGLIDEIGGAYNVDPKRVFLIGHSNGGFMSYRMACEHSDVIAGIATLAGATWLDPAKCGASEPINVLHVHGTMDETIAYEGGRILGVAYPSAAETVGYWMGINECDAVGDATPAPLDLESSLAGAETSVVRYSAGCVAGGEMEFWTINGGGHTPALTDQWAPTLLDWLLAHPKP